MTTDNPVPPPEDEIRRTLSGPAWDASRERAASESAAYFAANPPEAPPPEWALDAAHEYFSDQWTHLGIPKGIAVNVSPLARLLASVREGALREGADLCHEIGVKRSEDAKTSTPEWVDAMRQQARGAFTCYRAMCGLRREPPSGGA